MPRLTPRDLALIFCNLRQVHEISRELLVGVASTLRQLPRVNLSPVLTIYQVMLPALCRYMCNFPHAMQALVRARQQLQQQHNLWLLQVPHLPALAACIHATSASLRALLASPCLFAQIGCQCLVGFNALASMPRHRLSVGQGLRRGMMRWKKATRRR